MVVVVVVQEGVASRHGGVGPLVDSACFLLVRSARRVHGYIRSLGVAVCWAGLISRKQTLASPTPAHTLGERSCTIHGQEPLKWVPCQGGPSVSPGGLTLLERCLGGWGSCQSAFVP